MTKPTIRFRIDFDAAHSVGPGKIELLEHIHETGSLSQAGKEIGMSYRRAWLLLDSLNTSFKSPVVTTSVGGKAGGGATLTALGLTLIREYRSMEKEFNTIAVKRLATLVAGVRIAKKSSTITRTPLVRSAAPRRVKVTRQSR